MDIRIFDNFEEDGQLTLFGLEEDFEELLPKESGSGESPLGEPSFEKPSSGEPLSEEASFKKPSSEKPLSGEPSSGQAGAGIRIRSCSSCGKLLFVREEGGGYVSGCNACGIRYVQK
ncbi:MAG: hypothetical protein NC123_12225 [Butyrivibrio sp.]|nr:hypothetical protein [Acetatifactor muris]MCM1560288.1 hypothetical protein [Butyrivibrio sp.]